MIRYGGRPWIRVVKEFRIWETATVNGRSIDINDDVLIYTRNKLCYVNNYKYYLIVWKSIIFFVMP